MIEKKKKNRLERVKEYYIHQIEMLYDPIIQQATALNEIYDVLMKKENQDLTPKSIAGLDLRFVDQVPNSDLFEIFIRNKKDSDQIKDFSSLQRNLLLLDKIKQSIEKELNQYMEIYTSLEKEWQENIEAISRLFDAFLSYAKKNKIAKGEDPFFEGFDKLTHNWYMLEAEGINNKDISVIIEHYITPLKELCIEYEGDDRILMLMPYIVRCQYVSNNITHKKKFFGDHFHQTAEKLVDSKQIIEDSLEHLTKAK